MRERGFTLTEVLLAIVVMTLGLLGLANLQFQSLRANQDAYHTSQAAFLAEEILERMRGNPVQALAGRYDLAYDAAGPAPVNCIGSSQTCSPEQLRAYDLSDWIATVAQRLPAGVGAISTAPGPAANARVTIRLRWENRLRWSGPTPGDASTTELRFDAVL